MIPHFVCWAGILAWLTWFANGLALPWALVVVLAGSIAWEAVEYERENLLGTGHEGWRNRLITDPLTNTAGALLGWWLTMRFM